MVSRNHETTDVLELPVQFEYNISYVHMDYEQPTSQILPNEEIMSHEYKPCQQALGVPVPDIKWI